MIRTEFSKLIVYCVLLAGLYVILYSSWVMWKLQDLSALPALIGAVFVEVGAATGFYYWKAKNENVLKIGKADKPR